MIANLYARISLGFLAAIGVSSSGIADPYSYSFNSVTGFSLDAPGLSGLPLYSATSAISGPNSDGGTSTTDAPRACLGTGCTSIPGNQFSPVGPGGSYIRADATSGLTTNVTEVSAVGISGSAGAATASLFTFIIPSGPDVAVTLQFNAAPQMVASLGVSDTGVAISSLVFLVTIKNNEQTFSETWAPNALNYTIMASVPGETKTYSLATADESFSHVFLLPAGSYGFTAAALECSGGGSPGEFAGISFGLPGGGSVACPEPGTFALFAAGLLGMVSTRRIRRN